MNFWMVWVSVDKQPFLKMRQDNCLIPHDKYRIMNSSSLDALDLSDNKYILRQKAIRNAYTLENSRGKEILKSKQKLFKMKEEFPFLDSQDNEVFSIKAKNLMDISGDYAVTDPEGNKMATLSKEFTFLTHVWRIRDEDENVIAVIRSRGKLFGLLRGFIDIMEFFPHKYSIEDSDGEQLGEIQGKFSIKDKYVIDLEQGIERKELILACAVAVDALEGN